MFGQYTSLPQQPPQYYHQPFHFQQQPQGFQQHQYHQQQPQHQPQYYQQQPLFTQQRFSANPKHSNGYAYEVLQSPPIELNQNVPSPYAPYSNTYPPKTQIPPPRNYRRRQRKCIDFGTSCTLSLVWISLVSSCAAIILLADYVSKTSGDGSATNDDLGTFVIFSSPLLIFATVINEVLIDRCWRRVVYSALGQDGHNMSNYDLARNLRAANFGWFSFIKRAFLWRLSRRDIASLASYMLLRWGTAVSIASAQMCVTWSETGSNKYTAHKRYVWIAGPITLHAISVFGTMLIWLMPPWTFFSDRFQDEGLIEQYRPYLERIQGGSAANHEAVADLLDPLREPKKSLTRPNKPGRQMGAKLKGFGPGLLAMNIPNIILWAFFRYTAPTDFFRSAVWRFGVQFMFLAMNIFYLLALDFTVWNLSLEGFSKRAKGRPNQNLRYLGYSSGIMLLVKACKQRRPIRVLLFLWLFWLQACYMRFTTGMFTMSVTMTGYGSYNDRKTFYDADVWWKLAIVSVVCIYPPFLIWLFTKSEVPICEQDGWRWATIAKNALSEPGYYGVRNGEAVWGIDVRPFSEWKGRDLL